MKLKRVISGGQTGADREGLEQAKLLGLETGGTAPKGWKTDEGPAPELGTLFGLVESHSSDYAVRTHQNVADSDVTVWFGTEDSPGFYCTRSGCKKHGKEFYINPDMLQLEYLANSFQTWNVAGNRRRKNPNVIGLVQDAFNIVKRLREKQEK